MARTKGSKNKPKIEVAEVQKTDTGSNGKTEIFYSPLETKYGKASAFDVREIEQGGQNVDERKEKEERKEVLKTEAPKLEPLGQGQAYFEAPDGTVVIGDDTRNEIWWRAGNKGRGMWINKKR